MQGSQVLQLPQLFTNRCYHRIQEEVTAHNSRSLNVFARLEPCFVHVARLNIWNKAGVEGIRNSVNYSMFAKFLILQRLQQTVSLCGEVKCCTTQITIELWCIEVIVWLLIHNIHRMVTLLLGRCPQWNCVGLALEHITHVNNIFVMRTMFINLMSIYWNACTVYPLWWFKIHYFASMVLKINYKHFVVSSLLPPPMSKSY